jgi:hypothetical protein
MKKIPISFNEEEEAKVKELAELLGIANVYGDFPKAVKFGINLALSTIKNQGKVYSDLDEVELAFYFSSIQRAELRARLLRKSKEMLEKAQKV